MAGVQLTLLQLMGVQERCLYEGPKSLDKDQP